MIREKFNKAELDAFGATCFGHLQGVDELAFSEQLVHELSLRRVRNQGVKDLEGLTYLIGEGRKENGKGKAKDIPKKVSKKIFVTCGELERVFKECKNMDDAFKLGLLYFADVVLIGVKNNIAVNLNYLDLIEDMDRFNSFAWGSISFEQLHDKPSFAASRRGRGRGRVEGG
ncbi:hypothetical protein DVH24_019872 [Malus domestica]|uniref:DUF1985 domain-containing protein n=1 Tax=Malus domestica TaxID=3750 RepID=A0A498I460_MALDO|nr:hypothetical protein DVH24_019872 [Malus domestica]